jgi:hypothetical protein
VQLLNAHGEISIGMERYISRFLTGKGLSPELFQETRFFSVEKGDTFYENLEFFKSLYDSLRTKWKRSQVIGDKIPKLYTKYEHIFERFPEARVIFVARNLIDIASSYKRRAQDSTDQAWSSHRDAVRAIDDWNTATSQTLAAMARFSGRIYILSYERLFIDEKGLDELFDFVGLKPNPDVRKHFQTGVERSSAVRANRSENLSVDEKLAICLRADTRSFRQLLESGHGGASHAQRTPTKSSTTPPKLPSPDSPQAQSTAISESGIRTIGGGGPKSGKYQDSDHAICDYQYAQLPGTTTLVRGPIPVDLSADFVVCLGGAHTLGRFVEYPYPALLQRQLGVPVLNLGHGGGKPEFYLQSPGIIEVINKAKCAVIQVMSARGSPNRFLKPTSHAHNIMSIAEGIAAAKNPAFVDAAYRNLLRQLEPARLQEAIEETRSNWLAEMERLLGRITVPKVLFWFSVRTPAYVAKFNNLDAMLGDYPQLVTEEMIGKLKPETDGYIQCVSNVGMPYTLRDAQSHEPVEVFPWQRESSTNNYYPSAEMHAIAADNLLPALRQLMPSIDTGTMLSALPKR